MNAPLDFDRLWIATSDQARGDAGAIKSVERTAARAASGRLNPRVRAWSIRKIKEAGAPASPKDRAKAIFDAIVREKIYVADPIDAEVIAGAACTLDRCGDLSLEGGDCDDLVVALVAAVESVGIRAAVLGHQYDEPTFEHVLGAVFDGSSWWYVDPAHKLPFGVARTPTRERWVAVPSLRVLCDQAGPCDRTLIDPFVEAGRAKGDFVGVGTGADMATLEPLEGRDLQSAQRDFALWSNALSASRAAMVREYQIMKATRGKLELPPIDDYVVASSSQSWTAEQEKRYRYLVDASAQALSYGLQGASGKRRIERDPETGRTGVIGMSYEPTLFVEGDGSLVFVRGTEFSAEVIPAGFVSAGPALVAVYVICATAVVLATAYMVTTTARDYIARQRAKDMIDHQKFLIGKGATPDQAKRYTDSLAEAAEREANSEANKNKEDPWGKLAEVGKFAAIALTATAGASALAALISAFRQPVVRSAY